MADITLALTRLGKRNSKADRYRGVGEWAASQIGRWIRAQQGARELHRGGSLGVWAQLSQDGGHTREDRGLGFAWEVLAVHTWVSLHEQE